MGLVPTQEETGEVGIFLLSVLPLLCLELWCGILDLGFKDVILPCGQSFFLLALSILFL